MRKLSTDARPGRFAPPVTLLGTQDFVEPEDVENANGRAVPVSDDPDRVQADGIDREQLVREAAYARYESRGRVDGHALEDWLNAEADVEHRPGCG